MTKKSKDKVVYLNPTIKSIIEALDAIQNRALDGTLEHLIVGYMKRDANGKAGDLSVVLYPGVSNIEFAGMAATLNQLAQEYISLTSYNAEVESYVSEEDKKPDEDK